MKQCQVKGNERYPSGCRGWSVECGGYRCMNCSYYGEKSIDLSPKYDKPIPYNPKPLYGTWSRQFVKTKIDERE